MTRSSEIVLVRAEPNRNFQPSSYFKWEGDDLRQKNIITEYVARPERRALEREWEINHRFLGVENWNWAQISYNQLPKRVLQTVILSRNFAQSLILLLTVTLPDSDKRPSVLWLTTIDISNTEEYQGVVIRPTRVFTDLLIEVFAFKSCVYLRCIQCHVN